jgi:hypothetical protein
MIPFTTWHPETRARGGGSRRRASRSAALLGAVALAFVTSAATPAAASTAFGDLNNFDVYNDTGTECHGFEIELEDVHSADVTYTYDWNHYGAPTITEDSIDPAHSKVRVRYAAKYDAATGSFSAYTAMPASAPSPTNGHQCTNPAVNVGCEHFGVGYYGRPSAIRYHWLVEDPTAPGSLIHGPAVNVATPSWTYCPPAPAQPVALVQAVIEVPPPAEVPVFEFGDAVWVKSIVTTSHNNQLVELKDLVSDDPDDPADKNWANGEPDEVEVEWHVLQTEFKNPDGANNELAGGLEDLPNGDEVITRRYEFYKYSGPLDPETNEAQCDNYPQISDPADPSYKPECDPATVDVLGDYIGAQMAGFNVEAVLGLIDHIQDGDLDEPYTTRTVVVGGNTPYVTSVTAGALPAGLTIDAASGVLSGTPAAAGRFSFTVTATDADAVQVTKDYTVVIHGPAGVDDCPDDPAKVDPGLCGCGVPDTDSDGDGTPDCLDACVADPAKTDPGACGCGAAEVDTNVNGIADCLEPQTDVGIAFRPSRPAVRANRNVSYALVARNAGPEIAADVVITASLTGVPFEIRRLAKGCAVAGDQIVCTVGNLAVGRKATRRIAVRPTGAGTLGVTARVASATADSNPANQSASVETVVNP